MRAWTNGCGCGFAASRDGGWAERAVEVVVTFNATPMPTLRSGGSCPCTNEPRPSAPVPPHACDTPTGDPDAGDLPVRVRREGGAQAPALPLWAWRWAIHGVLGTPPNLRVHGADVAANPSFPSADVTREPARTPTVFTSPACHASRCHG